jgi:hypothetical protein
MNHKDLEKLLRLCRKYGVSALKTTDIQLSLSHEMPPTIKPPETKEVKPTTEYSEEDMLLWSSTTV